MPSSFQCEFDGCKGEVCAVEKAMEYLGPGYEVGKKSWSCLRRVRRRSVIVGLVC